MNVRLFDYYIIFNYSIFNVSALVASEVGSPATQVTSQVSSLAR